MRKTGKINYFNKERGFGFLVSEDYVRSFVHINHVSGNDGKYPEVGQHFSYIEVKCKKGIMAIDVVPVVPIA